MILHLRRAILIKAKCPTQLRRKLVGNETVEDVDIHTELTESQQQNLKALILAYEEVIKDIPGKNDDMRALLERLRMANLTVKPSKCKLENTQVDFLGHTLGEGKLMASTEKETHMTQCERPTTKKEVRSFLGLVGYYRNFIPHFSTVSAPLSDATRKGSPNKFIWDDSLEKSKCAKVADEIEAQGASVFIAQGAL
ncbi:POL-like protein [Mya arenaria]|uniref:POL-like protein n=1 Tax=Mya arenaria TaxID=6604 RepID=A0ABY7G3K5_MYAAR|nr:POL-like protein [Mya arenaria]